MHTFLNCALSKFECDLPSVAIKNYFLTDKIVDIFAIFSDFFPKSQKLPQLVL